MGRDSVGQVVIENPVINSAFGEPRRHYKFDDDGITDEIVGGRRSSAYFVPIAQPKKKGKQLVFDTEWTQDRVRENEFINRVRGRVDIWRRGGHRNVTKTTRLLLDHWRAPNRERRLFFCQIEALETAIYLTECAAKFGDTWIENTLRDANAQAGADLYRIAFKMATGSGKTVVMAMLIAWQALNKFANPQDARFSDTFLIVTPGITIRDRLRVLLPNDPDNYYRAMDVAPQELQGELNKAKVLVANFHAFLLHEKTPSSKLGKAILRGRGADEQSPFTETPDQMVRRVCLDFGAKKNIVVINDEAHHCYHRKPPDQVDEAAGGVLVDRLGGDDRREAQDRDEEARVWISGLEAIKAKIGIRAIYDLSATPFFLRGSGYSEGTLFPWVVSDFSLIDAIECGIVKVPRVPVADDAMTGALPTYRELWTHVKDSLPKKGRKTEDVSGGGPPKLPAALEGALYSLYGNYEKSYALWEKMRDEAPAAPNGAAGASYLTPPVFIVVCNNTNVSKLVYDWISGWEIPLPGGGLAFKTGNLPLFSNCDDIGWSDRPNTILVDSKQLESGEAMSPEFKKVASREIDEFKAEYRERFPGRSADELTDEDLLREVMNTIGKPGKLGEQIKCVVSVSMLTEGWDANTVTHILGVRAFSTQLLCEQVVGRGLRRMTYVPNADDMFDPQYAEVYGVPFSFIPCAGQGIPQPPRVPTRVRALEERIACEITFPRLQGYRYELPSKRLSAHFTDDSRMALSTHDIPTKVENAPIVGESVVHTLDELKAKRPQQVSFLLAKLVLEKYFRQDGERRPERAAEHHFDQAVQAWLFPQVHEIARRWLSECLVCKDECFPQLLLLIEFAHNAADKIYRAIVEGEAGEKRLMPILQPYDTIGSTRYVDFDTTRAVMPTDPEKCHVSHVVCDTDSWEQKMAQTLEDMPEVVRYVKNHNLGFFIPYTFNGEEHRYVPDFIVQVRSEGAGPPASEGAPPDSEPLNLIIEVSGEAKKEKAAKVETARNLWAPAVNNHGGFGRWAFLEISDPWDAKSTIRATIAAEVSA
jgi:type III restriction enzyme